MIGQFIARAIADDCIAPKYVMKFKGTVDDEHKQAALDKAELLLSRKHGIVRLDNIWGTGGGIRPVKYLVKQVCFNENFFFFKIRKLFKRHFHLEERSSELFVIGQINVAEPCSTFELALSLSSSRWYCC